MKEKKVKSQKKEKKDKLTLLAVGMNILLIVCICLFLYSLFKIGEWGYSNVKSEGTYDDIIDDVVTQGETDDQDSIDFNKLKEINPDVVGWIRVSTTNIDYPILKASDNSFYLNKDINKQSNTCGSLFMDYQNASDFSDNNTVIFGHNLALGNMFSGLYDIARNKNGTDIDVTIITETKSTKYKVFSSYIENPNGESIVPGLNQKEEYQNFIDRAIQRSSINYNVEATTENKMVTLSTCDNSGRKRTIVHAIKTSDLIIPSPIDE